MSEYVFEFWINDSWIDYYKANIDYLMNPELNERLPDDYIQELYDIDHKKLIKYDIKRALENKIDEINQNSKDIKVLYFDYSTSNSDKTAYIIFKLEILNKNLVDSEIRKIIYSSFNVFLNTDYHEIPISLFYNEYTKKSGDPIACHDIIYKLND